SDGMPARLSPRGRNARELDIVPVRAGSDVLGLLAVGHGADGGAPPGRVRALEHGSTVLALELSKERAAAEVERRLRGDLVEQLLTGGLEPDEAERVARHAERLGHRMPGRAWVVVIEPDDGDAEQQFAQRADRLDAMVGDLVRRRAAGALALVRATAVVLLVPEEAAPDLAGAERIAAQAQQVVAGL